MTVSTSSTEVLAVDVIDGVIWLTKNNPEEGCGMSGVLIEAMHAALDRARNDQDIRAVVIDAAGEGFHAGAVVFNEIKPSHEEMVEADFHFVMEMGYRLGWAIADLPLPVITIAAGGALGGGLELMLRSDFAYCTNAARFTLPEVTAGLIPGWGGTQWAGRMMPYRKAQEFILLGEPIDGQTAEEFGLVTRSLPDREALYAHVEKVLTRLRRCAPDAFAGAKSSLAEIWEGPLSHGIAKEKSASMKVKNNRTFAKGIKARKAGMAYDFYAEQEIQP